MRKYSYPDFMQAICLNHITKYTIDKKQCWAFFFNSSEINNEIKLFALWIKNSSLGIQCGFHIIMAPAWRQNSRMCKILPHRSCFTTCQSDLSVRAHFGEDHLGYHPMACAEPPGDQGLWKAGPVWPTWPHSMTRWLQGWGKGWRCPCGLQSSLCHHFSRHCHG